MSIVFCPRGLQLTSWYRFQGSPHSKKTTVSVWTCIPFGTPIRMTSVNLLLFPIIFRWQNTVVLKWKHYLIYSSCSRTIIHGFQLETMNTKASKIPIHSFKSASVILHLSNWQTTVNLQVFIKWSLKSFIASREIEKFSRKKHFRSQGFHILPCGKHFHSIHLTGFSKTALLYQETVRSDCKLIRDN